MIIRSPHPDVSIPDLPLHTYVLAGARDLGTKPALVDAVSGRTLTYEELWHSTQRVAAGLVRLGMSPGDVVGVCMPNMPEFAVAFYGVLAAGGTVTTLSPLATVDELTRQLEDCGARYVLAGAWCLGKAGEAATACGVEQVLAVDGEEEALSRPPSGRDSETLAALAAVPEASRNVAVLPYSSGTTGLPKGVMLTHRNLVANLCQLEQAEALAPCDRIMAVLPFCHIYGLQAVLSLGLRAGVTVVTLPRFDLDQFLIAVAGYRVTRASLVPPVIMALARDPVVGRHDLSSLERVVSAAAPLAGELAVACARRLGCSVVQGYGLTEASPATHVVPVGRVSFDPASVGEPLANTECLLADLDTGAELGLGGTGELWVRGPQVMRGYLNHPAATKQMLDRDGWLHTGDLVRVTEDGRFYVLDRVKELIKYKGYQVAPAELEAVLLSHPSVADAAVIPAFDEEAGEVPKAFVVVDGALRRDELVRWVADRVAPYKRVRSVEAVVAVPRSPAGKVLRRVLIDRERATRGE